MKEKTSYRKHIVDLILRDVITQIFASMASKFYQMQFPCHSSSHEVLFPSDLHFDYKAPFNFMLRGHNCLIEGSNFKDLNFVFLDSVLFYFDKSLPVGGSGRQN